MSATTTPVRAGAARSSALGITPMARCRYQPELFEVTHEIGKKQVRKMPIDVLERAQSICYRCPLFAECKAGIAAAKPENQPVAIVQAALIYDYDGRGFDDALDFHAEGNTRKNKAPAAGRQRTCEKCDKPFTVLSRHGRPKYCGQECREAIHREQVVASDARRREQQRAHPGEPDTHCPQGDPYDEENTRYDAAGRRYCQTCKRLAGLARQAAA